MPRELFFFSHTTHKRAARRVLHSHVACLTVVFCASTARGKGQVRLNNAFYFQATYPIGVKMGLHLVFRVLNNNIFFSQ